MDYVQTIRKHPQTINGDFPQQTFTKCQKANLQNRETADTGVAVGELLRERNAGSMVSAFLVAPPDSWTNTCPAK